MKYLNQILNFISIFASWFLNLFPYADKVAHFLFIGFPITSLSIWIGFDKWTAFGFGFVAGLAKEMGWDFFKKGHVSWFDWFATIAGSLAATLVFG